MAYLRLITHDELYLIDLSRVIYFMADDHYTHVYYSSKMNFLVPFGLSKIEEQLAHHMHDEERTYMRLGRKYIVNLKHVFYISTARQQLYLADDNGQNMILQVSKPVLRSLHGMMSKNT